jgi:hypothetical protein
VDTLTCKKNLPLSLSYIHHVCMHAPYKIFPFLNVSNPNRYDTKKSVGHFVCAVCSHIENIYIEWVKLKKKEKKNRALAKILYTCSNTHAIRLHVLGWKWRKDFHFLLFFFKFRHRENFLSLIRGKIH